MVKGLNPQALIEESPLLSCDALIHVLHWEEDTIRKVTKGLFYVDHPPPSVGH